MGTAQPLKEIFMRYEHYTFQAFLEVSILYSKVVSSDEYIRLCEKIGREEVCIFHAWKEFLDSIPSYVHPIIVSSSIREVWQSMKSFHIEQHGQSSGLGRASVIAGNNVSLHPYVVGDTSKALVAKTLRKLHGGCQIISFGDSSLDIPMLSESDYAYVVVNRKMNRSMKKFIAKALSGTTRARLNQLIDLDTNRLSQLWHDGLPIQTLESLLKDLMTASNNAVIDCTSASIAAQVLATHTRDANLRGPTLQRKDGRIIG